MLLTILVYPVKVVMGKSTIMVSSSTFVTMNDFGVYKIYAAGLNRHTILDQYVVLT